MSYKLWSDKSINELRQEFRWKPEIARVAGENMIELIIEANNRHEKAMLEKDVQLSELKGALKTFEYMAKGTAQ